MSDPASASSSSLVNRRRGAQFSLAARTSLPWIGLGIGASAVGALVVALLLFLQGTSEDIDRHRGLFLLIAGVYVAVAMIIGSLWMAFLQRRTIVWFGLSRTPTPEEAHQALRLPMDAALVSGTLWLLGVVILSSSAGILGSPKDAFDTALTIGLGGFTTVGLTYLSTELATRPITTTALAETTSGPGAPGPISTTVLRRLILTWALASGVPLLGILLIITPPDLGHNDPKVSLIVLSAGGLLLGVVGTALLARAVASPLQSLRLALDRVSRGDTSLHVPVNDASEIGLVQNSVNNLVTGLREQERMRDLFGRHVGTEVAHYALEFGASLSGDVREVTALFVDVVDSTGLAAHTPPDDLVAMLNQLFSIVVETVNARGGLVNQFQGDATLCIFGAPIPLADSATPALSVAREIRDRVRELKTIDLGIGVARGSVFAGQLGTHQRMQYTVIGDPVNEAARLSDNAKHLVSRILASDEVISACDEHERAHWVKHEVLHLRGRNKPTTSWTDADA